MKELKKSRPTGYKGSKKRYKNFLKDYKINEKCNNGFCFADTEIREIFLADKLENLSYYFNREKFGQVLFKAEYADENIFDGVSSFVEISEKWDYLNNEVIRLPLETWNKFDESDNYWEVEIVFDNDYMINAKGKKKSPLGYKKLVGILKEFI